MWLFPVSFDDPSTPPIDYETRYTGSGAGMRPVEPVGVPGVAFLREDDADLLEASPTGQSGNYIQMAPLPSVDIILAMQAAVDPSAQGTKVTPAKLAALGNIDAGDLVYGTDAATLTKRVGVVP